MSKRQTGWCDRCESTVYTDDVHVCVEAVEGEVWKHVVGFEGRYAVSNKGRVYSFPKTHQPDKSKSGWVSDGKLLNGVVFPSGHLRVGLYKQGKATPVMRFVHVLVAEAFIGPKPNAMHTRHLDGNPLNNDVENLRYGTAKENAEDRSVHGRTWVKPKGAPKQKLSVQDVQDIRNSSLSLTECAKHYGVSLYTILSIRSRRAWRHVA